MAVLWLPTRDPQSQVKWAKAIAPCSLASGVFGRLVISPKVDNSQYKFTNGTIA